MFRLSSDSDSEEWQADRSERVFEVRCVLSRDVGFARHIPADLDCQDGDSFLAVGEIQPGQLVLYAGPVRCELELSSAGTVAGLKGELKARSPVDAKTAFVRAILPALNHLSFSADVPLIISSVLVVDRKHDAVRMSYTSPYENQPLSSATGPLVPELLPIYALYREAKSSTSPYYRFLCYYKILEGIYSHIRPRLFTEARAKGIEIRTAKETIPAHPELTQQFPQYVGRPIKELADNELQQDYRNGLAHFLTDESSVFDPTDPDLAARFHRIMLVTELACRTVISQQEEYHRQFRQQTAAG